MTASPAYAVPVFQDEAVTVYEGDCLDVLPSLPSGSVRAVVTDPPYGLDFMGKAWDSFDRSRQKVRGSGGRQARFGNHAVRLQAAGAPTYQVWCERWARECLRVSSPGGYLVAFGGARTWHRLVIGLEDAGFEIRDSIAWLYATGFPKSLDIAKALRRSGQASRQWQGWGTNLKPGFEPIIVARKPLAGTVAATVREYGTGGLHIDACRVPIDETDRAKIDAEHVGMDPATYQRRPGTSLNLSTRPLRFKPAHAHELGRWPANVVLTHAPGCDARCAPGCPVAELNEQSVAVATHGRPTDRGAARYFPAFRWQSKASRAERLRVDGQAHPTVKPLELVRWLVRLVTPEGGVVLDPFLGSGTTAEAARLEGCRCIGIEREAEYLPLIRERLAGYSA
jgi:site-specific DNA-methyltransferase (adenine-specific)